MVSSRLYELVKTFQNTGSIQRQVLQTKFTIYTGDKYFNNNKSRRREGVGLFTFSKSNKRNV
jgi:hypothetical protein